jgi:hypothetical protein
MSAAHLLSRIRGRLGRHFVEPIRRRRCARANADRILDPIFVSGAMGSGTTVLGLELGQRFETSGFVDESCLIARKHSLLHLEPVASHDRIRSFQESLFPRADWRIEVGRKQMLALYREQADHASGPIIDKAANAHLCRIDFLSRCFPDAPILVIFRDPAANIEGFRRKWPTFQRDSLVESIGFYRTIYEAFLDQRAKWTGKNLLLSYESLTSDPDASFGVIRDALDLVPTTGARDISSRANVSGQGLRNVGRDGIQIVADANERALADIGREDVESIRMALADLHSRLLRVADNV